MRGLKVLLVSDRALSAGSLAVRLESEGGCFVVGIAGSLSQAGDILKRLFVDVICLDAEVVANREADAALRMLRPIRTNLRVVVYDLTGEGGTGESAASVGIVEMADTKTSFEQIMCSLDVQERDENPRVVESD